MKKTKTSIIMSLIVISFLTHASARGLQTEGAWVLGSGEIVDAAFSPNGEYIATVGSLGVLIWDADELEIVNAYPDIIKMNELKWSPDSKKLFVTDLYKRSGHGSYVVDVNSQHALEILAKAKWPFLSSGGTQSPRSQFESPLHNNSVNFSNDSSEFLIITIENQVVIYNVVDGSVIETIEPKEEGNFTVAGYRSNQEKIWLGTTQRLFLPDPTSLAPYITRITISTLDRNTKQIENIYSYDQRDNPKIPTIPGLDRLTSDDLFLVESLQTISGGQASFESKVRAIDSNFSLFSFARGGGSFISHTGEVKFMTFFPNRFQYQPENNRFISLVDASSFARIQIAEVLDSSDNGVEGFREDIITFNFNQYLHNRLMKTPRLL